MSDLTDFLLERIAEDEKEATSYQEDLNENPPSVYDMVQVGWIDAGSPERVLAECEAKRRIVEALVDAEAAIATYDSDDPNNPPSYWQEWGNLHALRFAAESHATAYADHPDYREEWKP